MAYQRHTWVDRQGTGLNKFTNSGTATDLILTPNPDSITQQGTPFTAVWMNELEDGIYNVQVLTGTGAPSASIGVLGQFYLDTASGALYQKKSNGWLIFGGKSWSQLGSYTSTAVSTGSVTINLSEYLDVYSSVYIYLSLKKSGSGTATVSVHLGNSSSGDTLVSHGLTSTTLMTSYSQFFINGLAGTYANLEPFYFDYYSGASGTMSYPVGKRAAPSDWHVNKLYLYNASSASIQSGAVVEVYGLA